MNPQQPEYADLHIHRIADVLDETPALAPHYSDRGENEWVAIDGDGNGKYARDEEAAAALQRAHRVACGRDPMTGDLSPDTFTVNVRAVVSGTPDKPGEDVGFDSKWELYDSSDEDGLVTLRLDTSVVQNAPNADEAVSLALLAAPPLNIVGMHEASVELWVDNDIDVAFVGEAHNG